MYKIISLLILALPFLTISRLDGTSAYNFKNEQIPILWDDNSEMFWDNSTPILWGDRSGL